MPRRIMVSSSSSSDPVDAKEQRLVVESTRLVHLSETGQVADDEVVPFLSGDEEGGIGNTAKRQQSTLLVGRRLSKWVLATSATLVAMATALIAIGGILLYDSAPVDGQSPPWYPCPLGGTVPSWEESYRKAKTLVERMSLVEKVNITTGTGWSMQLCVGNTGPANNVGFPALCLQDGPLGLRFADHATAFPAGITVGATWNKTLMRIRGAAHGEEARHKGINVLLGPAMGPLGRHPAGGRMWEGFGADPVLQGVAAAETIKGIQSQGVIATAKHWVGNEQEHFRKSYEWGLPHAITSNIGDRPLHEIYAWPFAESVRAGVASVMCSYQLVNNSYACANSLLMNGILKDELGFQGFVQSDWLAQRSGVASALAGLDMSMPGDGLHWMDGKSFFGPEMTIAALNGSLPMARVNDMATRVVAAWYQLGQDSWNSSGPNFSSWTNDEAGKLHVGASNSDEMGVVNHFVDVRLDHDSIARQVAAEGIVLVKNVDNTLPLTSIQKSGQLRIAIVGEDAGPGKGPNVCVDRACNQGTLAVGWGSGASEFAYLVDPASGLTKALSGSAKIATYLSNDRSEDFRRAIQDQDLCIVFANADSGEGYLAWDNVRGDRNDLYLQKDGDALISAVAEACEKTIVVVHAVGPVMVEKWADHPNIKAILLAHLPGQESGNSLADVMLGNVDASGRLPYTVGKRLEDYGPTAGVLYYPNAAVPQANFDEGLYIDYRYFDKFGIEPRYPFGFGMSYTAFELSDLIVLPVRENSPLPSPRTSDVTPPKYDDTIPSAESALFPNGFQKLKHYIYPYIDNVDQVKQGPYPYPADYTKPHVPSGAGGEQGGNPSLYDTHVQLEVRVTNTGSRMGQTVVQVYVAMPEGHREESSEELIDFPVKVLRAFEKVHLEPGDVSVISMNLTRKDFSYWSVVQQNWVMPQGEFGIMVGQSSRDLCLEGVY